MFFLRPSGLVYELGQSTADYQHDHEPGIARTRESVHPDG
jgi:hypothetical protein